jgi:hypothetical protein
MTFVANDGENGDWYFEDGMYTRFKDEKINARIAGIYLPSPVGFREQNGRELAPTAKVLWEHWNAN